MTKTLLVDAGGVLFNNITEETDFIEILSDRYGVDSESLRSHLDEQEFAYETGQRNVHEILRMCISLSGCDDPVEWDPRAVDRLYLSRVHTYQKVFSRLRKIRSKMPNVRIALANNEAKHWDILKNREHGHFELFDILLSSWALGAVKPREPYFSGLLHTLAVSALDVVLVDDSTEVVTAAARLGVKTVLFTGPGSLDEALELLLAAPAK